MTTLKLGRGCLGSSPRLWGVEGAWRRRGVDYRRGEDDIGGLPSWSLEQGDSPQRASGDWE